MILTEDARKEFEWLNDLASLPSDVRAAVLVLLAALGDEERPTLHSEQTVYIPK